MDDWSLPKPRLALLLEHFAAVEDVLEPWRVAYPLREVLFLAVCVPIPTKPPVYNGMIAPRDSWMMPPPVTR
jgi:hypothetical protein